MAYIQVTHSIQRYLWSIAIALFSIVLITSSLFSQTITPASGTLTLNIIINNDDGGQATSGDFQATFDGTPVAWGTPFGVNAGTYPVGVSSAPTGYSTTGWDDDCTPSGSITIVLGDYKCSITYDDIAPTLTLIKVLPNNDGGTATSNDFQAKIDGSDVSWNTAHSVDAGDHTVSETALPGYQASDWGGDCQPGGAITLDPGQNATCTITNDDIKPTLKLIKIVQNTNGGTATAANFQAKVNGGNVAWNTAVPFNAGNYTVSETGMSGYTASGWSGGCKANGEVTLAPGDNAVCTITNSDTPAQLKLVKTVQNNHGGTAVANDFQAKIDNNNVAWNTFVPLSAGTHSASESGLAGYTASSWGGNCQANGSITLAVGQTATCSITNSDVAATLKLVKTVINNDGGTATSANFQAKIDNGNVAWDVAIPVTPGQHTASEINLPGYVAAVWGGDCATDGQVTVALGENKVCTITNDDAPATLIVIKKVINDHGGLLTAGQFNLKVTGNAPTPAIFVGSETGTNVALSPGSYNVSETPPTSYTATYSPECSGSIALGETKTCTVTNDDKPARLRIIKQVVNDNGGTLTVPDFALFIDGVPVTSGSFISVTAGLHTVSETPHPRYAGTFSSNCAGGQTTLNLGQQRTCTLVNNDRPLGITIQKSASSVSVQPGTVVVYSYDVSTSDAVSLTNISVSDDKCAPMQPVNSGSVNSGDSNQNSTLDQGEVWKYTCSTVLQVDTVNIATVQGTPIGGGLPVSATAQATVDVRATIQVTTTPSTSSVPPAGGIVNFTVKIRNLSQGDLVTIQSLQDDIFGTITDANNPKLQTTNCVTPRAIAIGAIYTCTFAALVSGTLGQQHINTLLAQGIDDDEQPVSGSASATVSITGSLLQPTKSAALAEDADQNSVPSPGDTLEYTVVMQNKGNEPASGILFQDTPDPNTTLFVGSVQASQGAVDTGNGSGHSTVKVTVGTINPNVAVTIRFKVKINDPLPNNVTQVKNQGAISGQTLAQTLTDDPNTLSVGDATITSLNLAPLIGGSKTARLVADRDNNGIATAGDTLEYKITITNQGSRIANGVMLNDTVDAQTFLEAGTVQTNRGTVTKGNQLGDSTVQVNVGDLAGSSAVIIFQVTIKNPLPAGVIQVSNQGLISGSNFPTTTTDDPTTPASNDPTKTQVAIGPLLDATKLATLSMDADQNGQPGPGDTLHYQIRIINSGNALASDVAFVDKLDENTTLLAGSVTTTQGDITRGNGSVDSEVNVTLNTINASGEVVITYKALVNNPLPPTVLKVVNQGLVTSQNLPPVLTDDPVTPAVDDPTQTQVRILPELAATKRATLLLDNDNDQVAEPGDTLLYEVALVNSGNATATAVNFVDIVDASTTLVPNSVQSSQGTIQLGNNPGDTQVQVEIGSLAGGGTQATISYRVTIKNPLPAQTVEMVNQGTVQSQELDPVRTDDPTTGAEQDATRTQVIASPRLQVIKQDLHWIDGDDDRQVTLNDQLLYQIKIINTGNIAATNVLLQDTVDPRTLLVDSSVQSSQGVVQQGNAVGDPGVTLAIGTIPPNGVVNIGFRVRVNANENGQLSNQAIVTHEQPAPSGTRAQPIQLVSDDPDTAESSDPTLTPIVRKGSGQDSGAQRLYMPLVRRSR